MALRPRFAPAHLLVALLLAASGLAGSHLATAQDATPEAGSGGTPRPAHIHTGTCDQLGDVVWPLTDVTTTGDAGAGTAIEGQSATVVEASLIEITGAEHAINVHQSADNLDTTIACGNVSGEETDGMLTISLEERSGSGFFGEATLEDLGDGTTAVSLVLTATQDEGLATPDIATPAADAGTEDATDTTDTVTAAPSSGTQYQAGQTIVVTVDSLRLRSEPATDAETLRGLAEGTELEVVSGPEEAEGYIWYEVEALDDDGGSGWVATGADFVDPAQ